MPPVMRRIITNLFLFILLFAALSASTPSIDSIRVAAHWLERQAEQHEISLRIKTDYYIGNEFTTIERNLPGRSVKEETPFRRSMPNIRLAADAFPDDIMSDVYARPLRELEIGDYTRYMTGWTEEPDLEYEPLMTERFTLFK
jgi:hypothetical protein